MMKKLIVSLLFPFMLLAGDFSEFEILKGKLHTGGFLEATNLGAGSDKQITISINYSVDPVWWLSLPVVEQYLIGEYQQKLPEGLLSQEGIDHLEKTKKINIYDSRGRVEAIVHHLGRAQYGKISAHKVHIAPTNKKSDLYVLFHPSIPGLGWDQLKLILHTPVPLLRDYVIEGKLK